MLYLQKYPLEVFLLALLLICSATHSAPAFPDAEAGSYAEISGTVGSGSKLLPNVKITVISGNTKYQTMSDKKGNFTVKCPKPGISNKIVIRWQKTGFPYASAYVEKIKLGEKVFLTISYDPIATKDSIYKLRLPANPSTGYTWSMQTCPKQLKYLDSSTEPLPADAPCGRGTYETWKFKASGSCTLVMQYRRQWEDKPVNRMHISHIYVH